MLSMTLLALRPPHGDERFGLQGLAGRLAIGTAALALSACEGIALRKCTGLLEDGRLQDAIERCGELYERTRRPVAGLTAARAHLALGEDDGVLEWEPRLRNSDQEAPLLELVAGIHRKRLDAGKALATYERLAEIHVASGNRGRAAESLHQMFYLAWEKSDYHAALEHAGEALELAQGTEGASIRGRIYQGLFAVLYDIGDLEAALEALAQAADSTPAADTSARAHVLANEAAVRLDQGRMNLAIQASQRALELSEGMDDRRFFRSVHVNLALAHLGLDDPPAAARSLERAWTYAEPDGSNRTSLLYTRGRVEFVQGRFGESARALRTALDDEPVPEWGWDLRYRLGLAEDAIGNSGSARVAFEGAVEVVEAMRTSLAVDDLKSWLLEEKRRPYEALFRLHARAGEGRRALAIFERAKARTFQEAFVRATSDVPMPHGAAAGLAAKRLQALQELLPRMSASGAVPARPVEALLDGLGERHLLAYFLAEEDLWLLTVSGHRIRIHGLGPSQVARNLVSQFQERWDDEEAATRVGNALLPAASLPEPGATLHVVTDGFLDGVPFAALRCRGRYLVERHPVTRVPSLDALVASVQYGRGPYGPAVVLADSRADLPRAAREAREVAAGLGISPLIGTAVVKATLQKAARARVLHLALHSGLSRAGPWMALADGDAGPDAILDGPLRPRLVVLASCVSATPRNRDFWGSLGAAFLAAGSPAVVASLRSIEDEAAREFVLRFYEEGGAADSAGGLARAQRAFIRAGRPPSFWAPFVHMGLSAPREKA